MQPTTQPVRRNDVLKVKIYSHAFEVSNITYRFTDFVRRFEKRFVQMGMIRENRRWIRAEVKSFSFFFKDRRAYRFHINSLDEFKQHCRNAGVPDELIEWEFVPLPTYESIELTIRPEWSLREHQVPAFEFATRTEGPVSRLIGLRPGAGKSFTTMYSAAQAKARTLYTYRGGFLEKWLVDYRKTYDLEKGDLVTVQGQKDLKALLENAKDGEPVAKIIAVTNATLRDYIKLYETHGNGLLQMGYACLPQDLFQLLGVQWRVIDEAHLDFHLHFMLDMFTHCERGISLSGTLISDDDVIRRMQFLAYPPQARYEGAAMEKYINVYVALYSLEDPRKLKYTNWANGQYSHNVLEQSMMKSKRMLDNYVQLIIQQIQLTYVSGRQEGDRALVFCASIEFCTLLTDRLREYYKNYRVERYVGSLDDPYENLTTPDIAVSTHGSAGTAVDIPGLTSVVMTHSMRSSPGSVQNLGRLRNIPGREIAYTFLVCEDIPKHLEYLEHRNKLLDVLAKNIRIDRTRIVV